MPEILVKEGTASKAATAAPERLARHAARLFVAGGTILLLGVGLDLFALWVLQRQDTIQWEFVALGTTTNSYTLMIVSVALFYGALAASRTESIAAYRLMAIVVIVMGLFGLTIGFLIGTNYLAVARDARITPDAASVFKSLVVKSGGVSLLFATGMLFAGVLGLRMPKRHNS
jgi:hypothetical protein